MGPPAGAKTCGEGSVIPVGSFRLHLGLNWLAISLMFLALGSELPAATILGKVTLRGTPPPSVLVDLTDFPDVRKVHPEALFTRHWLLAPDGGLQNVFVYVKEGLEGKKFPAPIGQPLLDQTNAGFYPYVLGVQTGQKFVIRNSEPYMDTVHALPKSNPEFNIAQPLTGMVSTNFFDRPEVLIKIKCEVHPWEFAFIGVVPHPFFAVTGPEGGFQLPGDLPTGEYVIEIAHPKAGTLQKKVSVSDQNPVKLDFTLSVPESVKK